MRKQEILSSGSDLRSNQFQYDVVAAFEQCDFIKQLIPDDRFSRIGVQWIGSLDSGKECVFRYVRPDVRHDQRTYIAAGIALVAQDYTETGVVSRQMRRMHVSYPETTGISVFSMEIGNTYAIMLGGLWYDPDSVWTYHIVEAMHAAYKYAAKIQHNFFISEQYFETPAGQSAHSLQ